MQHLHGFSQIIPLACATIALAFPQITQAAKPAREKTARTQIPPGGPAKNIAFPQPTRFRLTAGTEVLVVERHTLPMVSIVVVWPIGSSQETQGKFGLTGLTAELLDQGTAKLSSLELARQLEQLGTTLDTFSNWDTIGVGMTTLTRHLDASLALLAEVVSAPAFEQKEMDRIRSRRLTTLLMRRDAPSLVANDALLQAVYGPAHRYGRPPIGTAADLQALQRQDIIAFAQTWLRPDLATIIVVGDVTPDQVRDQMQRALAAWTKPSTPPPAATPLTQPAAMAKLTIVDRPGAPQSEIRLGQPGVPRTSVDYFPLLVLNTIFGGQFSSRLNMNLREAHGYTYGARSDMSFYRYGGPFTIATPVKTETTAAAINETLLELARLAKRDITDDELRLAKDLLERALAVRLETVAQVASELAAIVIYHLPDDYLSTYAVHVEAVTVDDLMRVAREHIDPKKLAIVIVGDQQKIASSLDVLKLPAPEILGGKVLTTPASATPAPITQPGNTNASPTSPTK